MDRFPEEVLSVLRIAGWHPGRHLADRIGEWRILHEKAGASLVKPAERFLLEFGDLTLTFPNLRLPKEKRLQEENLVRFELDPMGAATCMGSRLIRELGLHLGMDFSLIGFSERDNCFFMMDSSGVGYDWAPPYIAVSEESPDAMVTAWIECMDPVRVLQPLGK